MLHFKPLTMALFWPNRVIQTFLLSFKMVRKRLFYSFSSKIIVHCTFLEQQPVGTVGSVFLAASVMDHVSVS
jgi:hypothetical protein